MNGFMPEHIQQMLFDFALERGYIEKLLEMKEELEMKGEDDE